MLESEIIALCEPVFVGPAKVEVLSMRPATPADRAAVARNVPAEEAGLRFAAHLCGVPEYAIRALHPLDGMRVAEALNRQMLGAAGR